MSGKNLTEEEQKQICHALITRPLIGSGIAFFAVGVFIYTQQSLVADWFSLKNSDLTGPSYVLMGVGILDMVIVMFLTRRKEKR